MGRIPSIDWLLAISLGFAALVALWARRRGGRFRGLGGWLGFWLLFAGILIALSRARPWVSIVLLGVMMYAGLRTYFFVAPVRPRDRYAILAAYLAIPLALYPSWVGQQAFLATVPVTLFLVFPVLLAVGTARQGLLESTGRILLGVLVFVFCAAHLALLVRSPHRGVLELFGILVLAADLPQRLSGRFGHGSGWLRPAAGLAVSAALAGALGFLAGPSCGLGQEDAARAGLLAAIAVAMGGAVTDAVLHDLGVSPSAARVGRAALLDRAVPAIYAAPVFFHYLDYFA
jgi:phosphatidate cytidylyltransferase